MMIRITKGLIAVKKTGEIVGFDTRDEYNTFTHSDEMKDTSVLFASPKFLYESLRDGNEAEDKLDELRGWVQENQYSWNEAPQKLMED